MFSKNTLMFVMVKAYYNNIKSPSMMKITTLLRIVFLQLLVVSLFSCEADSVDDFEVLAFEEPVYIDTANYFPSGIGNTWEYVTAQGISETLEVRNETEVNGEIFYEINLFNGKYAAIRKDASNYELRLQGEAVQSAGYEMQGTYYKLFLFDHNAEVGDVWESTENYTVSFIPQENQPVRPSEDFEADVVSELLERDLTLKIKDITYEDVIKVRLSITAIGKTTMYTYYFANNVGIVKYSEGVNSVQLQKYSFKG